MDSPVRFSLDCVESVALGEERLKSETGYDAIVYGFGGFSNRSLGGGFGDSSGISALAKSLTPGVLVIGWSGDPSNSILAEKQGADGFAYKDPTDWKQEALKQQLLKYLG